ncbi:hypothetical protein A3D78_04925 [Candidatus Gottesmanbacteria bacterium RIFCSPHIGHO2_02_FULL_39_14]|uniref:Uncharacterized protein n=1 Tax=Candidatus Gottesmanbacteria bacterium RIFCSPHIGHO2_02_FULL_39_14 TaxID=1798383 RepID=A0A1F5ZV97_9BACT|nr:MAG: hypothetical protein A3D78_04925 [Candidatus Gottesmanbacteria bacterium RIFCSPHIGHO2_02_FULL_39_14]
MRPEASPLKIKDYQTPGHILDLNPFKRNQIAMFSDSLEKYLPGFYEGRYLGEEQEYLKSISILDKDVIRGLIFLNCESYQEMKEKVYQRIETMGKYYGIRKSNDLKGVEPVEETGFSTKEIIEVLDFVERAMEGRLRRTNEPAFTHILRVVNRALDFISYDSKLYNSGLTVFPLTPDAAKALILMSALHDFLEPGRTLSNGMKVPYGDYQTTEILIDGKIRDKLTFRRFGKVINLEKMKFKIKGKVSFIMDCDHRGHFINGLEALRSEGETEEQEFSRLRRYHDSKVAESIPFSGRYLMWFYMPFLVRIFDRRDNLDTYLISKRNKVSKNPLMRIDDLTDLADYELGPPSIREILDKTVGTLKNIGYAEQIFVNILSHSNIASFNSEQILSVALGIHKSLPNRIREIFGRKISGEPFITRAVKSGIYNPEVLKMLPSRIAAYYLFGLSMSEIYKNNPFHVKGCWMPEPI